MKLKPLNIGPERFYIFYMEKMYYNLTTSYLHDGVNHHQRAGQTAQNASKIIEKYGKYIPHDEFEVRSTHGTIMSGSEFIKAYPPNDLPLDPFDGDTPLLDQKEE